MTTQAKCQNQKGWQGLTTEDMRGAWVEEKQLKRKEYSYELWGQTRFSFHLVEWPESWWMGSQEEHWYILFRKSGFEMLLGACFLRPVNGGVECTDFETKQSWVQTLALQLSRCVVLDLSELSFLISRQANNNTSITGLLSSLNGYVSSRVPAIPYVINMDASINNNK